MSPAMNTVRIARVYDDPGEDDGIRVLVDGIWPRGLSKEKADLDEWLKEIAPTKQLRQWYGHDPEKWDEFVSRYDDELADADHTDAVRRLRELASRGTITLLTATKDLDLSHTKVLRDLLS